MATYTVRVRVEEIRSTYIEIEADDWEEAESLASSMYYKGEVEFDPRDNHSEFVTFETEEEEV